MEIDDLLILSFIFPGWCHKNVPNCISVTDCRVASGLAWQTLTTSSFLCVPIMYHSLQYPNISYCIVGKLFFSIGGLARCSLPFRVYFRGGGTRGCFRSLPLPLGNWLSLFLMWGCSPLRIWICPLLKFATMHLPPLERNPEINPGLADQSHDIVHALI